MIDEQSAGPIANYDEDIVQFRLEPVVIGVLQVVAYGYSVAVTFLGVPMIQKFARGYVLVGKVAASNGDTIPLVGGVVQVRIKRLDRVVDGILLQYHARMAVHDGHDVGRHGQGVRASLANQQMKLVDGGLHPLHSP